MGAATLPAVLAAALLAAPAPPTFTVGVGNVNLDVQVSRGGRPVEGLAASDFLVTDNGVPQQVEIVAHESARVDAVLALDSSASVSGERLRELQRAAHAFVDALWPTDSVTVLGFATGLSLRAPAEDGAVEANAAIDRFSGSGSTSLFDAVYAALLLCDPARGRPLVLVFSDGRDHGSWLPPEAVRAVAQASDAVVHAVVVGDEDRSFLDEVARDTGGRSWATRSNRELRDAFVGALEEFRSRYRLRYEPRGVRAQGWHAVSVKLRSKKGEVRARRGYQVGPRSR